MILANPNNWFPWVDQVDRPYFIAIDKQNQIYSEFTDFDLANPATAQSNNWYEQVDKDNLKFFIIKGRFGHYYLEMNTGLFFVDCQHETGNHPIQTQIFGLQIHDTVITGKERLYELKHFKTSDVELMGGPPKILRGMNCSPPTNLQEIIKSQTDPEKKVQPVFLKPKHPSQTEHLHFGWELWVANLGRVTFQGAVSNRAPGFFLSLLYTPLEDTTGEFARIIRFDVQGQKEQQLPINGEVKKGDKIHWSRKVI